MKLATIQGLQRVLYDPAAPGEFNIQTCRSLRDRAVDECLDAVEEAANRGADLIVTTEAVNVSVFPQDTRYDFAESAEPMDGPIVSRFCDLARRKNCYIVAGLYTRREGTAYNSALFLSRNGDLLGIYDKVHLPVGEVGYLQGGDGYIQFETEFGVVAPLICWDLQFPESARIVSLKGADLIVCPTWGWENIYGLSRAYENGVWIAAAMAVPPRGYLWDNNDPGCIVDGAGKVRASAARDRAGIVLADVDIRERPSLQYGINPLAGFGSMRDVRLGLRRPDTYAELSR